MVWPSWASVLSEAATLTATGLHAPLRVLLTSHGVKVTLTETFEPEPGPTAPGPEASPNQLHVALTVPPVLLLTPRLAPPTSTLLLCTTALAADGSSSKRMAAMSVDVPVTLN